MAQNTLTEKRIQAITSFVLAFVALIGMCSASYAWLAISRTPIVSDLDMTIMTESKLEIAPDDNGRPGEWDVSLDLSALIADVVPLRPVTYSKTNDTLYAPLYDIDGRTTGATIALSDEVNANVKGTGNPAAKMQGYYIAITYWVRGSQYESVYLSEALEVDEGLAGSGTYVIGNPVWNGEALSHTNGGNGLETALRIGFRCQDTDLDGNPTGESRFYIYEPNADAHAGGGTGVVETSSMDGGALIDGEYLIRQSASTWSETTPVLSDSVVYSLGQFEEQKNLFNITPKTMTKITMYVWLEGRDVDCIGQVTQGDTNIRACIQFASSGKNGNTGIERD